MLWQGAVRLRVTDRGPAGSGTLEPIVVRTWYAPTARTTETPCAPVKAPLTVVFPPANHPSVVVALAVSHALATSAAA